MTDTIEKRMRVVAREAGLSLVELHERVVDDEWIELKPKWERHRDWPISFAGVFRAGPVPDKD